MERCEGFTLMTAFYAVRNPLHSWAQVVGPHEFMRNTEGLGGRILSDQALLQSLGFDVVVLRISALPKGPDSVLPQLQFLSALLSRHGITHPVPVADAAAATPQEFAPRPQQRFAQQQPRPQGYTRSFREPQSQQGPVRTRADDAEGEWQPSAADGPPRRRGPAAPRPSSLPDLSISSAPPSVRQLQPATAQSRPADRGFSFSRMADPERQQSPSASSRSTGSREARANGTTRMPRSRRQRQDRGFPEEGLSKARGSSRGPPDAVPQPSGSSEGAWGRVDAAAFNESLAQADGEWGGWDTLDGSAAAAAAPSSNGSSSEDQSPATPRGDRKAGRSGGGKGLRRTRNSMDLPSMANVADADRHAVQRQKAGSWNEW